MPSYAKEIFAHYASCWATEPSVKRWNKGPIRELPGSFCVLEFSPTMSRDTWTYATCAMSQPLDDKPLELHLFSPVQTDLHVELLTAIAHYHRTGRQIGLGHTINFGRPWLPVSKCEFGLISLPYLDGPTLQEFHSVQCERIVQFLWLIPITAREREHASARGVEALEKKFEASGFNYCDPLRLSVV